MRNILFKLANAGMPINKKTIEFIRKQEDIEFMQNKISQLKQNIADTDYKIIKCAEYATANVELPYDIKKLHEERQAYRKEINKFETMIETILNEMQS